MRLAILYLAAVLLSGPAAHAATVSVAGSTLVVVAAPGESNRLTIASGGAVTDARRSARGRHRVHGGRRRALVRGHLGGDRRPRRRRRHADAHDLPAAA